MIAPGSSPSRRVGRVYDLIGVRFFVTDQSTVGRARAVDAVLPSRLPETLITTEEGEVNPRGQRGLYVGALGPGPVLVMADGKIDRVVGDQIPVTCSVYTGKVADVVTVCLQPAHHGILGTEQEG